MKFGISTFVADEGVRPDLLGLGTPEDIGSLVSLLLSEDAGSITSPVIVADAGLLLPGAV